MTSSKVSHTLIKQGILFVFLCLIGLSSVYAIDLSTAKQQGLVGERNDGYLGYVSKPPSAKIKALVQAVNSKRRAIFSGSAKKNNISQNKVALRFYERAVSSTSAGRFYQNKSGKWIKK